MKPISPARREALTRKPKTFIQRRPVRDDQISVRFTPEERTAVEAMAVSRGLNSGGSLLRMLFLAECQRSRKAG